MASTLPDITATPAQDQHILHDGKEFTTIKEGLAYILVPADSPKVPQTTPKGQTQVQSVFYNPIQQFNRDLSVLAIKAYGESILERKSKALEQNIQKKVARKENKRKRGIEAGSEGPRKAGKVDSDRISPQAPALQGDENVKKDGTIADDATTQNQTDESNTLSVNIEATAETTEAPNTNEQEQVKPSQSGTPKFTILDALSATGLRALRYAQEIPFATSVTANDLLPAATKSIELNVKHNRQEGKIKALTGNAIRHMYSFVGDDNREWTGRAPPSGKYDVIDLDPYGTAAPFLDAAVQAVRDDGGLLCVTCTDAGVWASNSYPEKAYSLYGGVTVKGPHSHEAGLRLILHAIATSAARNGLAIEPLLSLSIDFYARVFVRIYKSPADVKFLAGKTMVVYNCDAGCGAWTTQLVGRNKLAQNKSGNDYFWKHVYAPGPSAGEHCRHCGMITHMGGPMYAGPLHSPEFIKRILDDLPNVSKDTYQTTDRIEGMLSVALEETLPSLEENPHSPTATLKTNKYDPAVVDEYPFFFIPSVLAKVIHCVTPHEGAFRGALKHLGYRVTRSHTKGGTIKTDAPWEVIWEVMREWARQKAPIREGAIKKNTAGYAIMGLDKEDTSKATNGDGNAATEVGELAPAAKTGKLEVIFDEKLGAEKDVKKLVRYQVNPRENWGPMNRAKAHV
ncbi:RNA methyltransferase tRNA(m5U54)methyltransferase [Clarireedia jacksonii]